MEKRTGATLVVETLKQQKVKYIFGIPGAKIDPVFNELNDHGIELIVCRHEQNAAFMAAAIGRLTGRPGVCMSTSGPGATNLVTGLATANTEGDPIVAISGAVRRNELFKRTHQSLDTVSVMKPATKMSVEVQDSNSISEVLTQAFRVALTPRKGAAFVSLPNDVIAETATAEVIAESPVFMAGPAPHEYLEKAADMLLHAKMPVLLVGERSNEPEVVAAIRDLLRRVPLPVVMTYQAAGLVSRDLYPLFVGRIGLFHNQPGDVLLSKADVILSIGYDPIEYDPHFWNKKKNAAIIHMDANNCDIDFYYQPQIELVGNIEKSVKGLTEILEPGHIIAYPQVEKLHLQFLEAKKRMPTLRKGDKVHPLQFIKELRDLISDSTIVTCDIGSHYIWMARYFETFEPRHLLFSNGQQTLGVGLPWAISASLVYPHEKIVSISGDGGFLFSSMELETAVRLKSNIIHFIWTDGSYDMVGFQEQMKYGRTAGVDFGPLDVVKYAESFGATGFRVKDAFGLKEVMKKAYETPGVVLVDIPIDYRDNIKLGKTLQEGALI